MKLLKFNSITTKFTKNRTSMTSKITYQGNLRTSATHMKSGNAIITDAPTDNHGKGEAFSPTDLVAASLGSCMLTIMGISAEKHGIDFKGAEIEITKIMSSHPRRIDEVVLAFKMNPAEYTEDQKAKLERAARSCPVALSLHPDLKQTISFQY